MNSINKKRKKELRELYEKIQDEKYVLELKLQPLCSSFEWVELMNRK